MHVLAATSDTWEVSGPTSLGIYAALAAVAVVATVLGRRSLARSHAPAPRLDDPDDIAYLHGGPELAVRTALSALHVAGRIASSDRRRIKAVGAVDPDAGELEQAIHRCAQHPVPRAELPAAPPVAEALGRIERRLIDAGLLLTAEQRKRIRHAGWLLWAVVAIGAIRAFAGGMAGKPIGLLLALLGVAAVGAVTLRLTAPRRTDRGNAELTRLRTTRASLAPRMRPNWQVYRPARAALRVAIFGMRALWAAHPAFAKELGRHQTTSAGDSGGGDSGDGGCGSGGCGGGGCGG